MADTLVPLIGSSEAGPLGAVHLPRLWLKVSLATRMASCPTTMMSAAGASTRWCWTVLER